MSLLLVTIQLSATVFLGNLAALLAELTDVWVSSVLVGSWFTLGVAIGWMIFRAGTTGDDPR